jgi:hypothetical protein
VTTQVARNANEAIVAPMVGLAESAFGGRLESGGQSCDGAFGGNLASLTVKMFTFNLFHKEMLFMYFQCDLQR